MKRVIEEAKRAPSVNHYFETGVTEIEEAEWHSLAIELGGKLEVYNKKMDRTFRSIRYDFVFRIMNESEL